MPWVPEKSKDGKWLGKSCCVGEKMETTFQGNL